LMDRATGWWHRRTHGPRTPRPRRCSPFRVWQGNLHLEPSFAHRAATSTESGRQRAITANGRDGSCRGRPRADGSCAWRFLALRRRGHQRSRPGDPHGPPRTLDGLTSASVRNEFPSSNRIESGRVLIFACAGGRPGLRDPALSRPLPEAGTGGEGVPTTAVAERPGPEKALVLAGTSSRSVWAPSEVTKNVAGRQRN